MENKERKFYNVYLNNNICCGERDSYLAPAVTDNLFRYIIGDNARKESKRDDNIRYLGWWKGHRTPIEPKDYCDDAMIIAELIDGKFYDVITGERFYHNKNNRVLKYLNFDSFSAISKETVVAELRKYDDASLARYRDAISEVKEATTERFKMYKDNLIAEQKKKDSIKNIVDNDFDSFIDNVKRRSRK